MIQSFNYSLFPNDEFLTFSLSVIAISEPRRAKIISIVPFLDRLITKNDMFESASKRELKNPETPVKDQKSENRKASYVAIRDFCGSASKRKNADINAAGKILTEFASTIQMQRKEANHVLNHRGINHAPVRGKS